MFGYSHWRLAGRCGQSYLRAANKKLWLHNKDKHETFFVCGNAWADGSRKPSNRSLPLTGSQLKQASVMDDSGEGNETEDGRG